MSYYEHAVLIAMRLGPWSRQPGPPFDIPAHGRNNGCGCNAARRRGRGLTLFGWLKARLTRHTKDRR
jgi:hypothetical protein